MVPGHAYTALQNGEGRRSRMTYAIQEPISVTYVFCYGAAAAGEADRLTRALAGLPARY